MLKSLATLFPYLRPYRTGMALGIGSLLMKDLLAASLPIVIKFGMDSLTKGFSIRIVLATGRTADRDFFGKRPVSVLDADHHHRDLARYRIRPAQQSVPASGGTLAGVLLALPHRRHHGPQYERFECCADDAGSRDHVLE